MCVVTEVRKATHQLSIEENLMRHEEVTLRDKKAPAPRSGPRTPRSSLKGSSQSSGKRKSVRFAQEARSRGPEGAEDFVLVTHQDAEAEEPNPQEDESTRPVLSEVCCLLTPSSEMTPREKSHVWWQARDYEIFKGTARLISSEIRRRNEASSNRRGSSNGIEGYASVLTRSLDACGLIPVASSEGEDLDSSNPLPGRLFAYLTHWVRVGHSRRGLERWSISSHFNHRSAARDDAIQTVLGEQRKLRVQAEEEGGGKDTIAEGLRRASRRATRSGRLFALAIGQADAAAIGSDAAVCPGIKAPPHPLDIEKSPRSVASRTVFSIV